MATPFLHAQATASLSCWFSACSTVPVSEKLNWLSCVLAPYVPLENILLSDRTPSATVKIADFGLARCYFSLPCAHRTQKRARLLVLMITTVASYVENSFRNPTVSIFETGTSQMTTNWERFADPLSTLLLRSLISAWTWKRCGVFFVQFFSLHGFETIAVFLSFQYTPAVDMWSIGVILYILLSVRRQTV